MKESGIQTPIKEKVRANMYGTMEAYMKGIGKMIKPTVKAASSMPRVTSTKANGKMIWPTDSVHILITTVQNMMAIGSRTSNTALV